ncbi:MAG: sugar nucleotidyltransferase [Saprospiraceae bacterium]
MKAIIPVAGAGTRLRPHTYTQPKPLIPVAGKPIISHIVDTLSVAGIREFVFVIGYLGEKIKDFLNETYADSDIEMTFVQQDQREGLGHAIWTARHSFSKEKEILIVVGDIIFEVDLAPVLESACSMVGIRKVEDPREFGVVEMGEEDEIVRKLIEKPRIPKSDLAITGIYKINDIPLLIDCLHINIANNMRTHGEIQLTDALDNMIEKGCKFKTFHVDIWFDCGKKEVLLDTNVMLLDKQPYLETPVFENTIFIHPVSIGENCEITNSIVGPHVTVGKGSKIESSIIKNSIIGSFAALDEVVLHQSIIGNDTAVHGLRQSLNLGDNTEIDFR